MPVVVTGASGSVGPSAIAAFTRISPEVRAYVRRRDSAASLRRLGAKVAVGEIDDIDRLEVVLTDAHTVCHLVGAFDLPDERSLLRVNFDSVRTVLEASSRAGVRRILFLSYPGASSRSANPFLKSKALAEEAIRASGLDHVIIRVARIYGPGHDWISFARWARSAKRPVAYVIGGGRQMVAPVYVEDVGQVLAAADDRERVTSGTWGLEGPSRLTMDELVDALAGKPITKVHLQHRWRVGFHRRWRGRPAARAADRIWAADSLADAPDAAAEFRVPLTHLAEGLERSLADEGAGRAQEAE